MDAKAKLKERHELFDDVFAHRHPRRVPTFSNISYWYVFDSGYDIDTALSNYEICKDIRDKYQNLLQFDILMNVAGQFPWRFNKSLGNPFMRISEAQDAIVYGDHHTLEADEYELYRTDPFQASWKMFSRVVQPGFTFGQLEDAIQKMGETGAMSAALVEDFINTHGAALMTKGAVMLPFEFIMGYLRGIQGASLDLRKHKSELQETIDYLWATTVEPTLPMLASYANDHEGYFVPVEIALLSHSILSIKQFEEVLWPQLKKSIDFCIQNNLRIFFYCEAEISRFAEYFEDIPKGVAAIQLENDSYFEFRKRLPNLALVGGMSIEKLRHGTPQECVDYAKRLVDELGDGFVLGQEKIISGKADAKLENLIAVQEWAQTYQY
jgi:hypothetical protein